MMQGQYGIGDSLTHEITRKYPELEWLNFQVEENKPKLRDDFQALATPLTDMQQSIVCLSFGNLFMNQAKR